MALDAITVCALAQQFQDDLLGARVDKIYQPERDELTLSLRTKEQSFRLLLSANSANPRAHFTQKAKQNPVSAPMFCMLLRKHLSGGKITAVLQPDFERILDFHIESYTELGDLTTKHLIAELMGRHSNIILTDENKKILDSIKHVDLTVSSVRQVLPGLTYEMPPKQHKINPLTGEYLELVQAVASVSDDLSVDRFIMKTIMGISPVIAREISYQCFGQTDVSVSRLSPDRQKQLCDTIFKLFETIRSHHFSPCVIYDMLSPKPLDFSAVSIGQYESAAKVIAVQNISEAVAQFFETRDAEERKKQKTADLLHLLHTNLDRCAKKIVLLSDTLHDSANMEKYKIYADLLTANLYQIKQGEPHAVLTNFYDPHACEVRIPLDVSMTPQQNAQRYYKKYTKAKTAQQQAALQLELAENEQKYLESVLQSCAMAESEQDLKELREELVAGGYIRHASNNRKNRQTARSRPLHFVSSDGFDIYCGKNNAQNDYLTLRFANSADLWFHTKNFPGSHTIIKLGIDKNVPETTIQEAAVLAATHSAAKQSAQVPVDYTQIKNVKKPAGAKPGMVIYDHYRTLYVKPDESLVSRLQAAASDHSPGAGV